MDIASAKSFYELRMDDSSLFHQYQTNPLDYPLDGLNFLAFSSERFDPESTHNRRGNSYLEAGVERPAKQLKTEYISTLASSSRIIAFDESNSISPATCQQVYGLESGSMNPNTEQESRENIKYLSSLISQGSYQYMEGDKRVVSVTRNPLNAREHVIAERKRREKLSQRFIALSAVLPGLKKIDKASILGDAIKHLKQLQERVKTLEEQAAKTKKESKFVVKKTHVFTDDETFSSDQILFDDHQSNQYLPEIEARVWDRDVIIRIHSEKIKGCIPSILSEIENLHLTVINSNVLPFGNSILDITVVAQMNFGLSMPAKDFLKNLKQALLKLL